MIPRFYTVMIELPENDNQRKQIVDALPMGGDFMGGKIVAADTENTFERLESLEALVGGY